MTTPLKLPQHFMMPMCQDRDIFPAHRRVKLAWTIGSICWPCHTETSMPTCPYTFFMRRASFERILRHHLLLSVPSRLVSDVCFLCGFCDGPCLSLSRTSFSSVNRKTYIVHQIRKLLNQIEARNTNYSLMGTTIALSPLCKRSDTSTPSDDQ